MLLCPKCLSIVLLFIDLVHFDTLTLLTLCTLTLCEVKVCPHDHQCDVYVIFAWIWFLGMNLEEVTVWMQRISHCLSMKPILASVHNFLDHKLDPRWINPNPAGTCVLVSI